MAYLVDTWTWADLQADIREYLGVPTGSDLQLELFTTAALRAGDQFMNNPFKQDEDGNWIDPDDLEDIAGVDVVPPDDVKLGVLEYVKSRNQRYATVAPDGTVITSRKTGDLSESYGVPSSGSDTGASTDFLPNEYWRPYRMRLLL